MERRFPSEDAVMPTGVFGVFGRGRPRQGRGAGGGEAVGGTTPIAMDGNWW